MKRFFTGLCAAVLTAIGGAEAQTGQPIGRIVINENFVITELQARGGLSDITFALAFTEQGGRVVVCAATAAPLSGTLRQVMRAVIIVESGTTILRGLQWAPNYAAGSDLVGQVAECQITGYPAPENPNFGFDLTRTRF